MFIGITLELEDGQEARIRFTQTTDSGAIVHCEPAKGCVHDISPEHVALLFGAIDVDYDGDALKSVREVVRENKAEALFQALHTSPSFLDNPQFQIVPDPWDDQALAELLELYLAGFTLEMLSGHFQVSVKGIVRKLSFIVWGEENLTQDRTKARFQQAWHRDEIEFLLSQLQLCRTPTEMAALMDRDSFGIAFKTFQSLPVPIPRDVQERLSITPRTEPLGSVLLDGKPF